MTDAQKLVIALPVVIGLVLAYNMLDWTSQFGHDDWTPIVTFAGVSGFVTSPFGAGCA
jgi:hypothetical protein